MKRLRGLFVFLAFLTFSLFLMSCGECDHSRLSEWWIYSDPTETEEGQLFRACMDCNHYSEYASGKMPVLSSSEYKVEMIKEPTCTEFGKGIFTYTVPDDGSEISFEKQLKKLPHKSLNPLYVDEETHYGQCICGLYYNLPHEYTETVIKEATSCSNPGQKKLECACGHFKTEEIKIDHTFSGAWTTLKVASCSEAGIRKNTCTVCKQEVEEEFFTEHNYQWSEAVMSTCTKKGHAAGDVCKDCGAVAEDVKVYEIDVHHYNNGVCRDCNDILECNVLYKYEGAEDKLVTVPYGTYFDDFIPESTETHIFKGWYIRDKKLDGSYKITGDMVVTSKFEEAIIIKTKEEFLKIYDNPDKSYYLAEDINLNGMVLNCIPEFSGDLYGFKGKNYTIKNFSMSMDGEVNNYGLFKANTGTIKNINFEDVTFSGNITSSKTSYFGMLVSVNKGLIDNVNLKNISMAPSYEKTNADIELSLSPFVGLNEGTIKNSSYSGVTNLIITVRTSNSWTTNDFIFNVGNICGANKGTLELNMASGDIIANTSISTSYNNGHKPRLHTNIGGLAGKNIGSGIINQCYADCTVDLNEVLYTGVSAYGGTFTYCALGGLVGVNQDTASINESISKGVVEGNGRDGGYVGGLVGDNTGTARISSCYSVCDVYTHYKIESGSQTIAGFAGSNSAVIQNSYSTGNVKSSVNTLAGGFVGHNSNGGTIAKCYTYSNIFVSAGLSNIFTAGNEGVITKSYYIDSIIYNKGNSTNGSVSATTEITEIGFNNLVSKDFLTNNLYWDDEGWYIGSDDNPYLAWEISKLHTFKDGVVYEPTCEGKGFTVYECSDCGLIYISDMVEALGHIDYTKEGTTILQDVKPTHTEKGKIVYACVHEEYNISHNHTVEINALGHDVVESVACSDLVDSKYQCSCGDYIDVDSSIITHTPQNVDYVAPSCGVLNEETNELTGTIIGNTAGRICKHCKITLAGNLELQPHTYEELEVLTPATCTEDGESKQQCSLCKHIAIVNIPKLNHDYSQGLKCSVCEELRFTIDQSYQAISTPQDLQAMIPNANYYLANDIDMTGISFTPLFNVDDPYQGIFLGNGYKISNLAIEAKNKDTSVSALFTAIGRNGVVADLTIDSATITAVNVNNLNLAVIAGINYGEISLCNIIGTTTVNLTTSVYSKEVGEIDRSYEYVVGLIAALNDKNAIISSCNVNNNIKINYNVESKLEVKGVKEYINQLINGTKITNTTTISYGSVSGHNQGKIIKTNVTAKIVNSLLVSSNVTVSNRGKAFTYIILNDASFVGVNTGTIKDSIATQKNNNITSGCVEYSNVTIKEEYYKITDNTVFENYSYIIGKTTSSSVIENLTIKS